MSFDVAIVGGGMVGATLGVALAPLNLRVAIIEAVSHNAAAQPSFDERTTALSNGSRRILETLGVLHRFEHVIISSEVGADKPSPRIFEEVLRRFDLGPKEVLHVGDEEEIDGIGARSAGMSAFVLGRDGDWREFLQNIRLLAESDPGLR